MHDIVIRPGAPHMPDGLAELAEEAEREGIAIVRTLTDRWRDGAERFDAPGEALLVALAEGRVVGVGGLTRCPHVPGALPVRRFYVSPGWRRRGVGRSLAEQLVRAGLARVDLVTCNAGASAAAAPFWESLGFVRVTTEGITHVLRRGSVAEVDGDAEVVTRPDPVSGFGPDE